MPFMRVMDGCVLLAVVFTLMPKIHLLRRAKPLHLKISTFLCYFALNLMRGNFTRYEALNRPFAISRLT
ncbi:MAG: hypothetical protein IPL33_18160 [Sphingobacteriales bacterium]|nr:hypothetical protein [Sphingobacteriales bacterium]